MNLQALSSFIWSVTDLLRGDYKRSEYGKVILPFTILRRLDCVLATNKAEVLAENKAKTQLGHNPEPFLLRKADQNLYNISQLDLSQLLDDQNNIRQNLYSYIQGFPQTSRDIFENLDFYTQIERLAKAGLLYLVVEKFTCIDLSADTIDNNQMGELFEELIRKIAEFSNEIAGEHYTPRDVINLMVELLFIDEDEALTAGNSVTRTIYDPAVGTGGMLSAARDYLIGRNPNACLFMFGQEINSESYAICKASMLLKGQDIQNIALGNTLSDDNFTDRKFDYMLSNLPLGANWKHIEQQIRKEYYEKGHYSRFGPGLPRTSDSTMLFILHLISKMKLSDEGGSRVGVIVSGSTLRTGGIGTGESEIRKWIIENNLLECIISLPENILPNTGISPFLLILSNKKNNYKKIKLINGKNNWELMRNSIGNKKRYISAQDIETISFLLKNDCKSDLIRIADSSDFLYKRYEIKFNSTSISKNIPLSKDAHKQFQSLLESGVVLKMESDSNIGCEFNFTSFFSEEEGIPPSPHPLGALLNKCTHNDNWDIAISKSRSIFKSKRMKITNKNLYDFYNTKQEIISPKYLELYFEFRHSEDTSKTNRLTKSKSEILSTWIECPSIKRQQSIIAFYQSKEEFLLKVSRLEDEQWDSESQTNIFPHSFKEYHNSNEYLIEILPHPLASLLHQINCETNKREILEDYRAFFECLGVFLSSIALGIIYTEIGVDTCKSTIKKTRNYKKLTMGTYYNLIKHAREEITKIKNEHLISIFANVTSEEIENILNECTKIRNEIAHHGLLKSLDENKYIEKYEYQLIKTTNLLENFFLETTLTKQLQQKWDGQHFENEMIALNGLASSPFSRTKSKSTKPLISGDLYFQTKAGENEVFIWLFHFVRCTEIIEGIDTEGFYFFNSIDEENSALIFRYSAFQPLIESKKVIDSKVLTEIYKQQ